MQQRTGKEVQGIMRLRWGERPLRQSARCRGCDCDSGTCRCVRREAEDLVVEEDRFVRGRSSFRCSVFNVMLLELSRREAPRAAAW